MTVNIPGLVSVVVFYLVVLGTGIWASKKSKKEEKKCTGKESEIAMVGGRNLNIWVSIFTTTATWIGGGFILGNAEVTYLPNKGLLWVIAPIGFALNLIVAALFFVRPVHKRKYVTVMDPFQEKYGDTLTSVLFIPSLLADVFWVACILAALGGTMSVILDIPSHLAVIISAAVAIMYTLLGGLYSVAYTDVIQLFLMLLGLWFCVPFALLSPASADITFTAVNELYQPPWIGRLELRDVGKWLDDLLMLTMGGVCYQALYQRILATATVRQAQITCYAGAAMCIILGVPPILIGAVAASTDWNQTSYGLPTPYEQDKAGSILPIVLQYLCPPFVSIAGIGAIAAAVMSSIDSALLSSSSLFARNIYKNIIRRKKASEREILCVVKVSVLLFGALGTGLAMTTSSVFVFWYLSGDMMYGVVCPQLLAVFFLSSYTNGYGSAVGLVAGVSLRYLMGEPTLRLPPLLILPGCRIEDGVHVQYFPFRTTTMLAALAVILLVSRLASFLFLHGLLPERWDIFGVRRPAITLRDVAPKELPEDSALNSALPFTSLNDAKPDALE
ncbi:high-affinity choline transporter 1-like [Scleropages formosus]|uniref:High-affinity choline transporter 1-like n=1 Tax=Scleropages formosus TaxID=113540 RepID=A0A8C9RWV7_SCLFO|nr:high-affinity choline transporter 1-like [Scleropages formosus]XP_018603808.2 high-affinity choline transporter 1-like [Scleropages formosus]